MMAPVDGNLFLIRPKGVWNIIEESQTVPQCLRKGIALFEGWWWMARQEIG
jgi:hypothetical protein